MLHSIPTIAIPLAAALALLPGAASAAQGLPVTTVVRPYDYIPILVPGATSVTPTAINNNGVIVGYFSDPLGTHGFIQDHGLTRTYDVPGATSTTIAGIDLAGNFVGSFSGGTTPAGNNQFVHRIDGTLSSVSNAPYRLIAVTQSGWLGAELDAPSANPGRILFTGLGGALDVQPLPAPGAITSRALGLASDGNFAGWYSDAAGTHGYVGTAGTLDVPGAVQTLVTGVATYNVNLVGQYETPTALHGFAYDQNAGELWDVDVPASMAVYSLPVSINAAQDIVGTYQAVVGGQTLGYLATPVGEAGGPTGDGGFVGTVLQGTGLGSDGSALDYLVTRTEGGAYDYSFTLSAAADPLTRIVIPLLAGTSISSILELPGFQARIVSPQDAGWSFLSSGSDGKAQFEAPDHVLLYTALDPFFAAIPGLPLTGFGFISPDGPVMGPFQLFNAAGGISFVDPPVPGHAVTEPDAPWALLLPAVLVLLACRGTALAVPRRRRAGG